MSMHTSRQHIVWRGWSVLGNLFQRFFLDFSSPEPKAPGEFIVYADSVVRSSVRLSIISNDFFSETTRPIVTKFHIQPPGLLGKKNYSNGLDHMTNMAAMPIYGKNLKTSSSPEPIDR